MLSTFLCAYWSFICLDSWNVYSSFFPTSVVWLFIIVFSGLFIYSEYKFFVKYLYCKYFFQSVTDLFIFLMESLDKQKFLILMKSFFLPTHVLSHQILVVLKGGRNTVAAWDRFKGICYDQVKPSTPDSSGYFPAAFDVLLD